MGFPLRKACEVSKKHDDQPIGGYHTGLCLLCSSFSQLGHSSMSKRLTNTPCVSSAIGKIDVANCKYIRIAGSYIYRFLAY